MLGPFAHIRSGLSAVAGTVCVIALMQVSSPVWAQAATSSKGPITVCAASSLRGVVKRWVPIFEEIHPIRVRTSYATSSTLVQQVKQGAPCDVVLLATTRWADSLALDNTAFARSKRVVASNRLVLAAPAVNPLVWKPSDGGLAQVLRGKIVIGDPGHVPVGMYARQALQSMGQWSTLKGRLVRARDAASVVRTVLAGDVRAGIVYLSDLTVRADLSLVYRFPIQDHNPIHYVVGAVSVASSARVFLDFLNGSPAQHILTDRGFLVGAQPVAEKVSPSLNNRTEESFLAQTVWLSLKVALASVILLFPFGVFFGWLLAKRSFPGRLLLSGLLQLPLVLPPVVSGFALLWLFGENGPLGGLGLMFDWKGAAVASAVVALPLFVRASRLGFEAVDSHLEDSARVLGASPWRVFRTITLPLARPGILAGMLLAFGRSLGEFGATITFVGNIAGETQTLPLALYSALQTPDAGDEAWTIALVSTALALITIVAGEWLVRRLTWPR